MLKIALSTFLCSIIFTGCTHYTEYQEGPQLSSIQIQDRNGLIETISNPERLQNYEETNFLSSQPFKKVLRVFKKDQKNTAIITSYHPNGLPWQYLEAQDMRAMGAFQEWHKNGQLKISATVIAGTADLANGVQKDWLFDQSAKIWDDQGNLIAEIQYENGFLQGKSNYYYSSGQLEKEIPYDRDLIHGMCLEFYANGTLRSETPYLSGLKEGLSQTFWKEQVLFCTEEYKEGLLLKGDYFSIKGEILSQVQNGFGFQTLLPDQNCFQMIEYRKGIPEGKVKTILNTGEIKNIFHLKKGKKQGEEIEYYTPSDDSYLSNCPKLLIPWEHDDISGLVKTWYCTGTLQSQKEYAKNKKNGSSLAWYKDGSLMLIEEYEEDRLVKGQYFKKNYKDPISTISNGTGSATLYDENGIFIQKIQYVKGKPLVKEDSF